MSEIPGYVLKQLGIVVIVIVIVIVRKGTIVIITASNRADHDDTDDNGQNPSRAWCLFNDFWLAFFFDNNRATGKSGGSAYCQCHG